MKFLKRKFKNDGFYFVSIIIAVISLFLCLASRISTKFGDNPYLFIDWIFNYLCFFPKLSSFYLKPWTIFTFQLVEFDIINTLFKVVVMLWCGVWFERTFGSKEFILFYLIQSLFTCVFITLASTLSYLLNVNFAPLLYTPLLSSWCLQMAMITLFSYFRREDRIMIYFVIPIKASLFPIIALVIDIIICFMNKGNSLVDLLGDIISVIFALLYLKLRMSQPLTPYFRSVVGR